jgi:hypothetical protein
MAVMAITGLYGRTAVRPYSNSSGRTSRPGEVLLGQECSPLFNPIQRHAGLKSKMMFMV